MGSTPCLIMLVRTDGQGLCCFPCSSFIGRSMPPTDAGSAGGIQCPLKRCTLENYKVPALVLNRILVWKIFAWSPAVLVAVIFEPLYDLRELHEMGSFYQNGVTLHQQQRQCLEESFFCIKVLTDKLAVRSFCMYAFY